MIKDFDKKGILWTILGAITATSLASICFLFFNNKKVENKPLENITNNALSEEHQYAEDMNNAYEKDRADYLVKNNLQLLGTDLFGDYNRRVGTYISYYTIKDYNVDFEIKVNWLKDAQKIDYKEVKSVFHKINPDKTIDNFCDNFSAWDSTSTCGIYMYKAGNILSPEKMKDLTVYYLFIPSDSPNHTYDRYIVFYYEPLNKFIVFNNVEIEAVGYLADWFDGSIDYTFAELNIPDKITIPKQTSVLVNRGGLSFDNYNAWQYSYGSLFSNAGGILDPFTKLTYEPYKDSEVVIVDSQYGPVYWRDNLYHIILVNGSVVVYDLKPYFLKNTYGDADKNMFPSGYEVEVEWNFVNTSTDTYIISGELSSGCGGSYVVKGTNVVNNEKWFNEDNLVEIGKTNKQEKVYELKDRETNEFYKNIFDRGYRGSVLSSANGESYESLLQQLDSVSDKDKYQIFLHDNPIFFWKDYLGNWRVYSKSKYREMGECGKPVIYLYPEKEMDVRVQVSPIGGFTKVEPDYPKGGWFVHATPNSELYNYANATTYPYLFWEGHSQGYIMPKQGFVFAKNDVPVKMRELLYETGLNEKEAEDFMEFWQEKLMVKDYVFVTFISRQVFDSMAPLSVSPRPDTVIRIFMDYTQMDTFKVVEPLPIETPKRQGFTVVEWGGLIKK